MMIQMESTAAPTEAPARYFSWTPAILGALAATALSSILVAFGATAGLGISSTAPTWRDASAALWLLSGLFLILQAALSFGVGGYIAGRTRVGLAAADPAEVEHRDGTPFLYLGDTAWVLFHRLTREDAERYLELRRAQGFTVIQAVVLVEFDGLTAPNAYGDRPLKDNDPGQSNEAYFAHVDWIVKKAAQKGLFVGTGVVKAIGTFTNHSTRRFDPPGSPGRGEDWVLVLDDTGYEYKPPAHRAPPVPSR